MSDQLTASIEVEKDLDWPLSVQAGIHYQLLSNFAIRLGISTQPSSIHFGFAYQWSNGFGIDVAASYHQVLGFTPAINITKALVKAD